MILIAAGVLMLGAGIWRQSTRASTAAPQTRVATSNSPSGGSASTGTPATNGASGSAPSAGGAVTSSLPGGDKLTSAEKELEALLRGFQEKVKTATDKQALAEEHATALLAFLQKHPQEKISDYVRIRLGQLQMSLGRAGAAVDTLREVAEHPRTVSVAPLAKLYLSQAQASAGDMAGARQTLGQVAQSKENPQVQKAAKQLLAQLEARDAITPGKKPPAFQAKDLSGQPQSLDRYKGKVVLIDFWATWCGPCLSEMPNVKAVYEKYKDRGFAVVGVSLDEEKETVKAFLKDRSLPWPQIVDGKGWKSSIARRYGVVSIPKMILLDRQGVIRFVDARGPALDAAVAQLVEQAS